MLYLGYFCPAFCVDVYRGNPSYISRRRERGKRELCVLIKH